MRSVSIALAIACVACSSSTGVDNTRRPGPSMKGMWSATDTLQQEIVLNLTQNDTGRVEGTGNIGADRLTAQGLNVIWPPCCQPGHACPPCALLFPIVLTVTDTSGAHLLLEGGFDKEDSNTVDIQALGVSPGFPFAVATPPPTLKLFRAHLVSLSHK
jgi:hypothetical protein